MEKILRKIKNLLPESLFHKFQPAYHYLFALSGALIYRSPSKEIYALGVTGTKGKSSVTEITNAILEEAGVKTGMVNGIRFKVGKESVPNKMKMTMPGRTLIQKKMREAVDAGCEVFILEMTSEGTKQFRHKFIELDGLIFTNLSPEHIEAHGSYEKYRAAKLEIARVLENSKKEERVMIANGDDKEAEKFLAASVEEKISYSLEDAKIYRTHEDGVELTFEGEHFASNLRGKMNISNILAGASFARYFGIDKKTIKKAVRNIQIPGRLEKIDAGQSFDVYVDYAHTSDSLRQVYEAFPSRKKICVLGATGGGRDKGKRKEMGGIADQHCEHIILTNEDPYDEDPRKIIDDVASGILHHRPEIFMSRRKAIERAINLARSGDVVFITGKGTDPYIMTANGGKIPWSDAHASRQVLQKSLAGKV